MKQINNWIKAIAIIALIMFSFQEGFAQQRAGSAGASELLINPWARTDLNRFSYPKN